MVNIIIKTLPLKKVWSFREKMRISEASMHYQSTFGAMIMAELYSFKNGDILDEKKSEIRNYLKSNTDNPLIIHPEKRKWISELKTFLNLKEIWDKDGKWINPLVIPHYNENDKEWECHPGTVRLQIMKLYGIETGEFLILNPKGNETHDEMKEILEYVFVDEGDGTRPVINQGLCHIFQKGHPLLNNTPWKKWLNDDDAKITWEY